MKAMARRPWGCVWGWQKGDERPDDGEEDEDGDKVGLIHSVRFQSFLEAVSVGGKQRAFFVLRGTFRRCHRGHFKRLRA